GRSVRLDGAALRRLGRPHRCRADPAAARREARCALGQRHHAGDAGRPPEALQHDGAAGRHGCRRRNAQRTGDERDRVSPGPRRERADRGAARAHRAAPALGRDRARQRRTIPQEEEQSMSASAPDGGRDNGRILRLAVPIILSNLSVPLVGLVDTAVMGRMPGPQGIGAVALGAVVFSFVYWGFGFLRMGTTGLVAREEGTRDQEAMAMAIGRSLALALALGLAVVLLQWPVANLAALLAPASAEVEAGMLEYFRIRVWSAPAVLVQYVLLGVFIGMQRTGHALLTQVALNVCNAALSVLFVIGYGWGIAGVASASLVAEYFGL